MSHIATKWLGDIPPKQMTHGEFRVLFHLCDCHNPSMGCFPQQKYLRDHTGLSNGGLNNALAALAAKGLIRREQKRDDRTNKQKPTHYILGFEIERDQEPTPLNGDGAVSTFEGEPSPLSGGGRLHLSGVDIDEPVKEPVKEPCAASPAHIFDFDEFCRDFASTYPRMGDVKETEEALRAALDDGVDPRHILHAAQVYAEEQKGNGRQYIAYSENWAKDARWTRVAAPVPVMSPSEKQAKLAERIKTGKAYFCTHITGVQARGLIAAGLVTEAECKAAGVNP